ncbi:MAG: hypothetical protein CUN49_17875, partial [Candidatus Thermofonsia Clade 1 bacterium]
ALPPLRPTPEAAPSKADTPSLQKAAPQPSAAITVDIRRGMPKNAEQIAQVLSRMLGRPFSRIDVLTAFGEKSYLLAEIDSKIMGLAGFQVENLITRVDEFLLLPEAPIEPVARALIQA